uniref:Uncharacterized protein n=1 Tax=Anguilla anguilla TaxID=7936 RepID=A0A0E9SAN5_ANGAN
MMETLLVIFSRNYKKESLLVNKRGQQPLIISSTIFQKIHCGKHELCLNITYTH